MPTVKCIILRSKFLISKHIIFFPSRRSHWYVSVTGNVQSVEPWNFKKNKGRKPLRLEKGKKKQKKILRKMSYISIEYSDIKQKACFDVNKCEFLGSGIYSANVRSIINPLRVNPTKWSNTFVWTCLTILWGLALKGLSYFFSESFFFSRSAQGKQGIITCTDFISQDFWFSLVCLMRSIKTKWRQVAWKCKLLPKNIRSLYVTFIYDVKLWKFEWGIHFWLAFLSLRNLLLAS